MGRQAPLGHHPGTGPVQLPTETRGSNLPMSGSVRRRQPSVGDFETEILGDNVEGVDDTENRRPAQRSRTQLNGTCHHNVHNPGADTNEARGSGGKNVIFSNRPYDQSKYSDPLIYVPI